MVWAISVWVPIASMVTMQPGRSRIFKSSGIAVISFDFSSTFRWPRTSSFSAAHALTIKIARLPSFWSFDPRKHPPEGVVRGDPVRQLQKRRQPLPFAIAKDLHVDPALRSAEDGADGDANDVDQFMILGAIYPRVSDFTKVLFDRCQGLLGHGYLLRDNQFYPISRFRCDCPAGE